MFSAQLLRPGTTVYSPWFPRGGDSARFAAQCIDAQNASLTVTFITKNREDPGPGKDADTSISIVVSTPGDIVKASVLGSVDSATGLKELVRYKFTATGDGEWILFRMLPIMWFHAAVA